MCRVDRKTTRQRALETHPKTYDVVGEETTKAGVGCQVKPNVTSAVFVPPCKSD